MTDNAPRNPCQVPAPYMSRGGGWLQTWSGRMFWPLDPRDDEVDICDIAHALAHQCRFGGHCRRFYSVAEHCVLLSHAVARGRFLQRFEDLGGRA